MPWLSRLTSTFPDRPWREIEPLVCGKEARTVLTDQYAPKAKPPMIARTRTLTNSQALRPFFLPDLPGWCPEELVVVGGIAVLAVLTRAAGGTGVLEQP